MAANYAEKGPPVALAVTDGDSPVGAAQPEAPALPPTATPPTAPSAKRRIKSVIALSRLSSKKPDDLRLSCPSPTAAQIKSPLQARGSDYFQCQEINSSRRETCRPMTPLARGDVESLMKRQDEMCDMFQSNFRKLEQMINGLQQSIQTGNASVKPSLAKLIAGGGQKAESVPPLRNKSVEKRSPVPGEAEEGGRSADTPSGAAKLRRFVTLAKGGDPQASGGIVSIGVGGIGGGAVKHQSFPTLYEDLDTQSEAASETTRGSDQGRCPKVPLTCPTPPAAGQPQNSQSFGLDQIYLEREGSADTQGRPDGDNAAHSRGKAPLAPSLDSLECPGLGEKDRLRPTDNAEVAYHASDGEQEEYEEEEEWEEEEEEEVLNEAEQQRIFDMRVRQAERSLAANKLYVMGDQVILPDSLVRQAIDSLYLIVAFFESIFVFYRMLWPEALTTLSHVPFVLGVTLFHTLFIKATSHTAVLAGYTLEDRSLAAIRESYRKSWFYFDLFTSIPYELIFVEFIWERYAATPKLLHAVRVLRLFQSANPLKPPPGWTTVVKAGFWTLWTINLIGVFYVIVDDLHKEDVRYSEDTRQDIFDRYLQGLYWATVTLSSVGYGDVVPENRYSRLYSLPIIMLSVIVLSFLTGQVASSVIRLDAFQQNVNEKKSKLYSLMKHYDVPWEVQKGAFNIYPTLLETSLKDYFEILEDLPPFMQAKVILCVKRKIVSRVPLFQGIEERTLTALAAVTQQVLVAPYEYIINAGDLGHEMYFIAQGVVEVLLSTPEGDEICAATLQSGSWFGEIALVKQTERTASIRSITACSCFKLQKHDFTGILRIFPGFESKIQASVEERLVNNAGQQGVSVRESPVSCGPDADAKGSPAPESPGNPLVVRRAMSFEVERPIAQLSQPRSPSTTVGGPVQSSFSDGESSRRTSGDPAMEGMMAASFIGLDRVVR